MSIPYGEAISMMMKIAEGMQDLHTFERKK
jgi:hypothetical protein